MSREEGEGKENPLRILRDLRATLFLPFKHRILLNGNYLSKNDKNMLTKNVFLAILDGMNTTQSSSKDVRQMSRIQKVSRVFRAILLVILILQVAVAVTGITKIVRLHHAQSTHLKSQFKEGDWTFNYSLSADTEYKDLILFPFGFMVTLNFFWLFTRLKDGHLFEGETVGFLEKAAKWWIALGIVQILYQFLGFVAPPHSANINVNEGGDAILCGLVVFFVAWLPREGQKLKEEQQLTV